MLCSLESSQTRRNHNGLESLNFLFRSGSQDEGGVAASALSHLLPPPPLPADVAPAESVRPLDAIDRRIGALLCLGDGLARRANIQHPPAIGENVSVLCDRA